MISNLFVYEMHRFILFLLFSLYTDDHNHNQDSGDFQLLYCSAGLWIMGSGRQFGKSGGGRLIEH